MKKITLILSILLTAGILFMSCTDENGYHTTSSGLKYKYIEHGKGKKAELNDMVFGKIKFYFNTPSDTTLINQAEQDSTLLFKITEGEEGDIMNEALRMLREGDNIELAFATDIIFKEHPEQRPDSTVKYFIYQIEVQKIQPEADYQQEQEALTIEAAALETEAIMNYVSEKGITIEPNEDGVYIIVTAKGRGREVAKDNTVFFNYTGKTIDGKVFDTSNEKIAKENDLYNAQRKYEPLEVKVGAGYVIPGMDHALAGLHQGDFVTLIIPSNVAYGANPQHPLGGKTLIFDMEIKQVK
jgi:FKBP-type peptidyl-prolyl cis-trans isomerase